MSIQNSYTTADYLEWDSAMNLVKQLYADKDYTFSLLFGCGCFFGLRISDLRSLTWEMILDKETFMHFEQKTGKRRIVKINRAFQQHIRKCYAELGKTDKEQRCFVSTWGGVYTIQSINLHFKKIRIKYQLKIQNFSTHSMRKTFGRRVLEAAGPGNEEMALIRLSDIFNHSSLQITRRYLGLRQEELSGVYDSLEF